MIGVVGSLLMKLLYQSSRHSHHRTARIGLFFMRNPSPNAFSTTSSSQVETVFQDLIKRMDDLALGRLLLELKRSLQFAKTSQDVESILSQRQAALLGPDCECLLRLIDILRRGHTPALALHVFAWKRKQPPAVFGPREYSKVIGLAGKLGQLETADALYEEMDRRGVVRTIDVENSLMLAHATKGSLPKALQIFQRLKDNSGPDLKPNLISFNTALFSYSKMRHLIYLDKTFEELIEARLRPSLETFNALMLGYRRLGLWWRMEEVFLKMKEALCTPNGLTFRTLIRGYAAAKLPDRMEEVYKEMQKRKISLKHATAEVMVAAYRQARDFQKMEKIIFAVKSQRFRSKMTKCMLKSYAFNDQLHDMEALVHEAMKTKELSFSSRLAAVVIEAFFKKKAYEKIDIFLEGADACGWIISRSLYNKLIYLNGKAGFFDKMENYFNRMLDSGCLPNERTFKYLLSAYQTSNMKEKASWVLHRMKCAGFCVCKDLENSPPGLE